MMRLRGLTLDRFGHFTDRRFDFGAAGDRPDFHIIYGRNEAGKTTTMEAALRLFYGFPARDPYAFRHQRANLRLSARVEIDGVARDFIRLPTRTASLTDATGAPLPEAALSAHLGGLGEADYRSLLCLDDETIERGGEEIVQARSDIGHLLFSAAAGIADLSTALTTIRQEADTLWKKRASKTRIAELKREHKEIEQALRAADITASAWKGLKKTLLQAELAETAARESRDALREQEAALKARRRALPLLAEIEDCDRRIAPHADYPDRLDYDPERLVTFLAEDRRAEGEIARLTEVIADLTAARDALPRAPGLLRLGPALDAIEPLRARDETARMDLDRRREARATHATAMEAAARDLGAAEGTDPQGLVLSPADLSRLEAARDSLRQAEERAETEAAEAADLAARLALAEEELAERLAEAPPDLSLDDILARHDADRLAPAVARATAAIAAAEQTARDALDALARGPRRFDALPDCPITAPQATALAQDHDRLTRQIDPLRDQIAAHRTETAARIAEAAQITRSGAVPDDAEAAELRAARDAAWRAHLADLSRDSAALFDTALRAEDAARDARLSHAGDLGELRQIDRARARSEAEETAASARHDALIAERTALTDRIDTLAQGLGLPVPMPPGDFRDWVAAQQGAARACLDRDRAIAAHADTLARAEALLAELAPLLRLDRPGLDTALDRARRLAQTGRDQAAARDRATRTRDRIAADLTRRAARAAEAEAMRVQAAQDWATLVDELMRGAVDAEALRATLDPLRALREAAAAHASVTHSIETMEADQAQFAAEVSRIAADHDLPVTDSPAADFAALRGHAAAAQAAEADYASQSDRIDTAQGELAGWQDRRRAIADDVTAMAALFPTGTGIDSIAALRAATATALAVMEARAQRARAVASLLADLGAADLAAVQDTLAAATPAGLQAEIAALAEQAAAADTALTRATEARVSAAADLARVTGDADMAALSERRAVLDLQIEEAARNHLELSLGHRLAEEAIRRYRDVHRSGMMAATEACFAALTDGAYPALQSQTDGPDEVLMAIDRAGTAKRVADMSKGTRFQLYLALRAAAHEQLAAQGICLPFFCDDIFETFDEDRTRAAVRVMERIGRTGQAIYLTHHHHVVDIAMAHCDTAPVLHEL